MAEINASNVVQEFRNADFFARVERNALYDLQYRNFFPLEFNIGLEFSTLEKAAGAQIMADIVALGSKAPRKGRDFVTKNMGTLSKIEIARDKDEYDMFKISSLRDAANRYPNNAGVTNQFVDAIYEDVDFTINGVNARLEFSAKQLASTGKITIVAGNNASGVKNVELDYKVATANAAKDWFTAADADPLAEIMARQDAARKLGFRYSFITMDPETLTKVLNSTSAKAFVLGSVIPANSILPSVTIEQLNAQLAVKRLPQIREWDSFVAHEGKDGVVAGLSGWETGNILFSVDSNIGATKYTVSEEFNINTNTTMAKAVKDNFILSKMWGTEDPQVLSTKATAFALPVMNNVKKNFILKTKLA